MDSNLGTESHPSAEKISKTAQKELSELIRPLLVAIPDSSELSFEEAAKLLRIKTRPCANEVQFDRDNLKLPIEVKQTDPYEKSRFKFIFVDTSDGPKPTLDHVLTRDLNGDLRTANGKERLLAIKRIWGSEHSKAFPRKDVAK